MPLHLLWSATGDVLVNAGGSGKVAGATASVGILWALVYQRPKCVLQAKASSRVRFLSVAVVINWKRDKGYNCYVCVKLLEKGLKDRWPTNKVNQEVVPLK